MSACVRACSHRALCRVLSCLVLFCSVLAAWKSGMGGVDEVEEEDREKGREGGEDRCVGRGR